MSLDRFCTPSANTKKPETFNFAEDTDFIVEYGSTYTNSRQPLFHACMSALYPMFTLMPRDEQHIFCRDCFEKIGYNIDKNRFYERYKFSHLCKKSELQNKFLQYEDISNDKAMQRVIVNFFDVNLVILSPNSECPIKLIPTTFEYERKPCLVLEQRQNKYYPYVSRSHSHNFIPSQRYSDIKKEFCNFTERKKYSLQPYYTYKIGGLLDLAKRFHVIRTKPGRYNKVVNKTKRELYDELMSIL